jgi:hypothetical protein
MKTENVHDVAIKETPKNQSPIFLIDIDFVIKTGKKEVPHAHENFVAKGTLTAIRQDKRIKRRLVMGSFKGKKDSEKRTAAEVEKVFIRAVSFKKFLGYGLLEI